MSSAQVLIRVGANQLAAAGIERPRGDAEWLLARLLDARPFDLYLNDPPVPADIARRFFAHLAARGAGTPLQYLLEEAEFFGLRLTVQPGVFIPRPETEAVVERAVQALRPLEAGRGRPLRLLDLGTGSGCIALALAQALPTCVVVGVELSWDALQVARQNARRQGLGDRVHFVQGNWTQALSGGFDAIISNPPYVPSAQVDRLPLEVRREPRLSLDVGEDGLRDLRRLLEDSGRLLLAGGLAVFECGEEQAEGLARAMGRQAWSGPVHVLQDVAGRARGVLVKKQG